MKLFFVLAMLMAANAHAGAVNELGIMATEEVEVTLDLYNLDYKYKFINQDIIPPTEQADTAIQTVVKVQNIVTSQTKEWTCVTQFVKTATFFDVLSTNCF